MTILTSAKKQIDLRGPEGNAFCLLGIASNFSKQLGFLTVNQFSDQI